MNNIYDQHYKAFAAVEAYLAIHPEGQQVRITFKHPNKGAGRLYCFVYLVGFEMSKGFADGYGYDKKNAAFYDAINKMEVINFESLKEEWYIKQQNECRESVESFKKCFQNKDEKDFDSVLRDLGFQVYPVI